MGAQSRGGHGDDLDGGRQWRRCPVGRLYAIPSGHFGCDNRLDGDPNLCPGVIHTSHALALFPAIVWRSLAETLLLALSGPIFAGYLRLPAASLLIPMMLGYALTYEGVMQIELPGWLLAAAYAVIGWRVGLRFTQTLLAHALKAFPAILASSLVLIAICALLAWLLVDLGYCDPLTAYLATAPEGRIPWPSSPRPARSIVLW